MAMCSKENQWSYNSEEILLLTKLPKAGHNLISRFWQISEVGRNWKVTIRGWGYQLTVVSATCLTLHIGWLVPPMVYFLLKKNIVHFNLQIIIEKFTRRKRTLEVLSCRSSYYSIFLFKGQWLLAACRHRESGLEESVTRRPVCSGSTHLQSELRGARCLEFKIVFKFSEFRG